jgi:uncharacterized protein YdhG (YjbR/CyaY superfamily)
MKIEANSPDDYISKLPEDRQEVISKLRKVVLDNLPKGFSEEMSYGMIGFVVPHSIYPDGYHCDPKLPLPFMSMASQKNFVAFYHMGIYADEKLLDWFVKEYPKHSKYKLDMGKSCIRFKRMNDIPYDLIGELVSKVSVDDWIDRYDSVVKR